MNIDQKKSKIATIALILVLTFSALLIALPVKAHDPPWEIDTFAFISAAPNPIGVGQTVLVVFWIDKLPPTAQGPNGDRWRGYEVTITKPDGNIEQRGPFTSDPVGLAYFTYQPDQVGTYNFQFSFPGQVLAEGDNPFMPNIAFVDDYFKPSTSSKTPLVVQQDPIQPYPDAPLPEGYWDRPIDAENRDWWKISGNWLGIGNTANFYSKAPNTAHIVWERPIAFGGIVGGNYGSTSYDSGLSYEAKLETCIIMNGVLYYNAPDPPFNGYFAIDLRTGEELWWHNSSQTIVVGAGSNARVDALTNGQLYNYESPNQHGVIPYLWSAGRSATNTWKMYDAFTGDWILDIANVTGGTTIFSEKGDILVYVLSGSQNTLTLWNSSKCIGPYGPIGTDAWKWRPSINKIIDWKDGIEWTVSVPDVPGSQSIVGISDGVILANTLISDDYPSVSVNVGYDANTGQQLWVQNHTTKALGVLANFIIGPVGEGVYVSTYYASMQWTGFDLMTGNELWTTEPPYEDAWAYVTRQAEIADGKLYTHSYDGKVHAYDLKTGQLEWIYSTGSSGFETVYGVYPLTAHRSAFIADNKVYIMTGEHSPSQPNFRGGRLHCIDSTTGDGVWNILGWYETSQPVVADGYLVAVNGYDNTLYCFGKGQTAITVDSPLTAVPLGSSLVIRGTVTDQSPGATGTPAIADEYMTQWMEYLYMQQPCPMMVNGVEVKLETLDPNGNFYEIGTVTSDASGMYKLMWEPPVPGEYTIIATFAGSESYFSSYAETAIGVATAQSAGGPIEPEPTEAPLITTELAVIIAAVIIAIALIAGFWILRKRK